MKTNFKNNLILFIYNEYRYKKILKNDLNDDIKKNTISFSKNSFKNINNSNYHN